MRFYFPDSQDMVSPTYDFISDEYLPHRVRQRDDIYAHQAITPPPYDGLLVSKAIIDGSVKGAGKYSMSQRERVYRLGVRDYFRLPEGVRSLGDCGAFNYIDEETPPYSVEEVIDFYERCRFDAGISVDHVLYGYDPRIPKSEIPIEWIKRKDLSLSYARQFWDTVNKRRSRFEPVGAAHGWSPDSYADSVAQLQDMGYRRIALGGMVPLKTPQILDCLQQIGEVREADTEFHLLGITRVEAMENFAQYGVTSFDSTSPFKQSFMDDRNNYHTADTAYTAIRVPQVDGNPTLKRRILSGAVPQREVVMAEKECLRALRAYGQFQASLDDVLDALGLYESLVDPKKKSRLNAYERTLTHRPWQACDCGLCQKLGIEIVIFRGTERNKSRGFHNLAVLSAKMHRIAIRQSARENIHG